MMFSYSKCPICGYISDEMDLDVVSELCPYCKKPANWKNSDECREIWPKRSQRKYLDMIETTLVDLRKKQEGKKEELIKEIKKIIDIPQSQILKILQTIDTIYNEGDDTEEMYINMFGKIEEEIGKTLPTINPIAEQILRKFLSNKLMEIYEKNTIVLITCTFLESFFDNLLVEILIQKGTPYNIAHTLIKSTRKKEDFFKKLIGKKLSKVLKELQLADFSKQWNVIRDKRNNFIHGNNPYAIKMEDVEKSRQLEYQSAEVFAKLHNKFCVKKLPIEGDINI